MKKLQGKRGLAKQFGLCALISFVFTGSVVGMTLSAVTNTESIDNKLHDIKHILDAKYFGDIDMETLEEGIYKGFVAGVGDPYTSYFTPEEFIEFMESASGIYAGIGVQMTLDKSDNSIQIVEVFKGSPAEKVGILPKDKIIGAAGQEIDGDDFNTVPDIIKGPEGTNVLVDIYRPSEDKTYTFDITRESVIYPSVEVKMLEGYDNIGYVELRSFEELTYNQLSAGIKSLENDGAKGLILDLRNNPGGLLHVVEQIVDEFLSDGIIVSVGMGAKAKPTLADRYMNNIPLVVLVNEQSASASEVLAGALKDHDRAKLVGSRTYGKGIVQTILPLIDNSALKVTTSEYYTPSGICIQGTGIEPDYPVELPADLLIKANLTFEEDLQLQKAVEVLTPLLSN
ncbi:MAG: peptidase S41 [Candidatus Epulonipiscioides saccharophilum]|nr:MAG: peptidase S41 [Epulopiscium sp. AS2M-Bin001]